MSLDSSARLRWAQNDIPVIMEPLFHELARLLESGQRAVLAAAIASRSSTPQKPGARLLLRVMPPG